ncbi:MAG: MCP four helix bundle domain-containing protein [Planctomycetes bacterium]|nr:MCP four helix bundle domain-containing protein [Planctomycetota bacterium]
MSRHRTFGQKIGFGFAITIALMILSGAISVYALRHVVASKDRVITDNGKRLVDAERMHVALERLVSSLRGYLLTNDQMFLERMDVQKKKFKAMVEKLSATGTTGVALLEEVDRLSNAYQEGGDKVIDMRRSNLPMEDITRFFEEQMVPRRDAIETAIAKFLEGEEAALEQASAESSRSANMAILVIAAMTLVGGLFGTIVAIVLARALGDQVGSAVGKIQSSAAELQAASNQQAMGTKEQATAMSEINTTIGELLATSRQISESARRVTQIATDTAAAADGGAMTVDSAQSSIAGIRRQVDLIVTHMLDLGKKSQEIGSVLDIVTELAEQTNILSINASIEAVTAGEHGKRFAVVAGEIRKLAGRVGGSVKEIRSLIDGIRSSVNTTVMATESGSKAVDAGLSRFGEVSSSFKRIAGMVSTTTDAAREIELSTKQQTSAVEQVTGAVSSVAQATKETEISTAETLQTASQLSHLSEDLMRLVQPGQQ